MKRRLHAITNMSVKQIIEQARAELDLIMVIVNQMDKNIKRSEEMRTPIIMFADAVATVRQIKMTHAPKSRAPECLRSADTENQNNATTRGAN